MSLPAATRHRWGLDDGGEVAYVDLGDAIVLMPGGAKRARAELIAAVTADDWDRARGGFGDAELANE